MDKSLIHTQLFYRNGFYAGDCSCDLLAGVYFDGRTQTYPGSKKEIALEKGRGPGTKNGKIKVDEWKGNFYNSLLQDTKKLCQMRCS